MNKGFTLIELIVAIAIIAVLSGIVLFGVTQYINKGKDSSIAGNLVILIPAGEVFYNSVGSYEGFCGSNILISAKAQMPVNTSGSCYNGSDNTAGVCCSEASPNFDAWAACAKEFADDDKAYCVDSRGIKKEICASSCTNALTVCPDDISCSPE
jgi:prepilin-type N-terminal cleavage/methylation domain-containing protein